MYRNSMSGNMFSAWQRLINASDMAAFPIREALFFTRKVLTDAKWGIMALASKSPTNYSKNRILSSGGARKASRALEPL